TAASRARSVIVKPRSSAVVSIACLPRIGLLRTRIVPALALLPGQPLRVQVSHEHFLEHVPVLRVPRDGRLENPGQLLGHHGDLLAAAAVAGDLDFRVDVRAPERPGIPQCHRHQRRPGMYGQRRRATHHPGCLAEELDLDPAAGKGTPAQKTDQAASSQPLRKHPEPTGPAGMRQNLHAQALPECHEPVIQRLRAQPLGHGGELPRSAQHDPGAGVFPVTHMRQRENHAASFCHLPERGLLLAGAPHPAENLLGWYHRQPEYLQPIPQVRTHSPSGQLPKIRGGSIGASRGGNPRQVRLQLPDPRALPPPGPVPDQPANPFPPPPPRRAAPTRSAPPPPRPRTRKKPRPATGYPPRPPLSPPGAPPPPKNPRHTGHRHGRAPGGGSANTQPTKWSACHEPPAFLLPPGPGAWRARSLRAQIRELYEPGG